MQDALLKWLAVVALYSACRLWLLVENWAGFRTSSWRDLGEALVQGVRFDLSILALVNAPLLLFCVVAPWRWVQKHQALCHRLTTVYLLLVNVPLLWLSMGDVFYFKFTGRRLNASLFNIGQDLREQTMSILWQYWPVSLLGLGIACVFYFAVDRRWQGNDKPRGPGPLWRRGLGVLGGCIALFLAIRGGWQLKPLSIAHAYELGDAGLGQLALNTPFSIFKSSADRIPTRRHDFADPAAWRSLLAYQASAPHGSMKGDNVVLIIVESLGAEYMRQPGARAGSVSYTPFIDGLAAKGLSFVHHYANGRRSIDAVPSIVAGIPSLMEEPFITSPFQGNEVWGLPRILGGVGYETRFYHGGNNGTMHFDVFAHVAGFQRYVGRHEYPEPQRDYDGQWGIWDEPFLAFMADELQTAPQPFFSTVFTLTSHNPFVVPEPYQRSLPEGSLPIHQAIAYSDYVLQQFFAKAATMPWYEHTLFVITGDHTSLTNVEDYANDRGRYRVPLIFFHPSRAFPKVDVAKPVQHVDILPSILDLLGVVPARRAYFNGSVFDPAYPGRAYNRLGEAWWLLTPENFVRGKPGDTPQVFAVEDNFARQPLTDPVRIAAMKQLMDAYATYFVNGLLDNSWYEDSSSGAKSEPGQSVKK